jgi:hypothetical protein
MSDTTLGQPILLVDTGGIVPDALVEHVEETVERSVRTTSDLETTRTILASDPIDCRNEIAG